MRWPSTDVTMLPSALLLTVQWCAMMERPGAATELPESRNTCKHIHGAAQHGMAQHSTAWHSMMRHGTVQPEQLNGPQNSTVRLVTLNSLRSDCACWQFSKPVASTLGVMYICHEDVSHDITAAGVYLDKCGPLQPIHMQGTTLTAGDQPITSQTTCAL